MKGRVVVRGGIVKDGSGHSDSEGTGKFWPHNFQKSTVFIPYLEKVCSNVRQRYRLSPGDKTEYVGVNAAIWRIFMSVTLQAAVHLGKDYTGNLRSTRNQP